MPKFTDALVAALVCPAGKKDVLFFDGELPGFGVRVTAAGKRVFLFQYRGAAGVRRMALGAFGSLTTKQARALAQVRLGEVRGGRDPQGERRDQKAAAAATKLATQHAGREAAYTLGRLVEDWNHRHLAGMRESYRRDAIGRIRLHLREMLNRPAAEIIKAEAVRELDRIANAAGETTARRVMGYARSAYGWAGKRGALASNPFEGLPPIGREVRRDRVLSPEEVTAVWEASGALSPVHGAFIRFLLLTLARREEVAQMRWAEVDGDTWTLPASRSKNRRAHVVPLPEAAEEVLRTVPRLDPEGLVFGTGPGKSLTSFSYMVRQLKAQTATSGWRLHDFRRTGVTRLAEMGFPPHVCDRLLNHVTGAIQGVAAVYQRAEFLAERRAALEGWASRIRNGET